MIQGVRLVKRTPVPFHLLWSTVRSLISAMTTRDIAIEMIEMYKLIHNKIAIGKHRSTSHSLRGGMSTSMLMAKMQQSAKQRQIDVSIVAMPEEKFKKA